MDDPAISVEKRILFQNDACLIINKLPGESSEFPDVMWISEEILVPVNRLDTPVSGCLLLAKTQEAAAFLGAALARPARDGKLCAIERKYWAIVENPPEGNLLPPEGELVHWLFENKKVNKSFAYPYSKTPPSLPGNAPEGQVSKEQPERYTRPKKAVLRCRLAGKGEHYLFLEIDLVTGRHHQIRAQLAALGLRIKGDLKYGAKRSERGGGIRLHSFSLAFPNPLGLHEIIRVKAEPPVMDALWLAFREAVEIL